MMEAVFSVVYLLNASALAWFVGYVLWQVFVAVFYRRRSSDETPMNWQAVVDSLERADQTGAHRMRPLPPPKPKPSNIRLSGYSMVNLPLDKD